MKTKAEIIKGLNDRLKILRKAHRILEKHDKISSTVRDFVTRIDEIESLLEWIKGRKAKK